MLRDGAKITPRYHPYSRHTSAHSGAKYALPLNAGRRRGLLYVSACGSGTTLGRFLPDACTDRILSGGAKAPYSYPSQPFSPLIIKCGALFVNTIGRQLSCRAVNEGASSGQLCNRFLFRGHKQYMLPLVALPHKILERFARIPGEILSHLLSFSASLKRMIRPLGRQSAQYRRPSSLRNFTWYCPFPSRLQSVICRSFLSHCKKAAACR